MEEFSSGSPSGIDVRIMYIGYIAIYELSKKCIDKAIFNFGQQNSKFRKNTLLRLFSLLSGLWGDHKGMFSKENSVK